MSDISWGYALNQWRPTYDYFVRRRDHERAFKTISINGFTGVELTAGSGRWDPFGNGKRIADTFGSVAGLREFAGECGIPTFSSYYYDPATGFNEDLSQGIDLLNAESTDAVVEKALWFANTLVELGGSTLLVRPAPSGWASGSLSDEQIAVLAETWNAVGRATAAVGITLAMHFDFLSALRIDNGLDRLIAATEPGVVGVALDTAELTIAGIDPVDFYRRHADRVVHVQFKDALTTDASEAFLTPRAELSVRRGGNENAPDRWFIEPGTSRGLVDFVALTHELVSNDYSGWVIFESDQSPNPASSVNFSGWYLKFVLQPIVANAIP